MDYIACILYAFLLISVVYKHLYNTSENQFFLYVLVICAVCTVADICMEISCRNVPLGQTRLVFAYAFSYIYLILRQVSAYAYILFIFVASGTIGRLFQNKIRSLSFIIPFLLTCVFILSNLISMVITNFCPFAFSSSKTPVCPKKDHVLKYDRIHAFLLQFP